MCDVLQCVTGTVKKVDQYVEWRLWEALEYYLNMCRVTTGAKFMCSFVYKNMLVFTP
jgi:hypothetical protein